MENDGGAVAQPSFAERKQAQLRQERESAPPETTPQGRPAPTGTPGMDLESAGDEYPVEELPSVDAEFEEEEEFEAPEGNPDDDLAPEDEAESTDWKARFEETQRKLSQVTENRTAIEQEQTEIISTNLTLKHELEDKFTEARRYADNFVNGFNQQIAGLENAFQTGQIEPEHLPQARQQYQNLINQRQHLLGSVEQFKAQEAEVKQVERARQAEISRVRLRRTIPGWGREKHKELGEYAASRGYTPEEFSGNLDYRYLELLNDSMQLNRAGSVVKGVKRQRKANGPVSNARQQPRSADGKYRQAKQALHDNPNQRGRFAEMKMAQLQKERGR